LFGYLFELSLEVPVNLLARFKSCDCSVHRPVRQIQPLHRSTQIRLSGFELEMITVVRDGLMVTDAMEKIRCADFLAKEADPKKAKKRKR